MIRRREPENRLFYAHDELPGVSPTNFYMRLQSVITEEGWEALAKPLRKAFSERLGRPTDPVVYLKAFLVGYLENIIYDTDLAERIADSIAVRRFLGFGPGERTPDHWTLGWVRADVARYCSVEEVLDEVVGRCIVAGMVDGQGSALDGSLVPANASLSSLRSLRTGKSVGEHLREARARNAQGEGAQAPAEGSPVMAGAVEGKGGATPGEEAEGQEGAGAVEAARCEGDGGQQEPEAGDTTQSKAKGLKVSNEEFRSETDPDARLAMKRGAPQDMYYRATHLVDGKSKIILAAGAAHADEGEPESAQPVVAEAQATLMARGLALGRVGTDTGYDSSDFHAYVEALGAQPVSNYHEEAQQKPEGFRKESFHYIVENNCYLCPRGCLLRYKCQDGKRQRYTSDPADCRKCPCRGQCLGKAGKQRWLTRNYTESCRDRSMAQCHTEEGRALLKAREHIVEPTFGRMKAYGGMGLVNCRGLGKANVKVVMAAVAWNLIRLVKCLNPVGGRLERAAEACPTAGQRCRRLWARLVAPWWRPRPRRANGAIQPASLAGRPAT